MAVYEIEEGVYYNTEIPEWYFQAQNTQDLGKQVLGEAIQNQTYEPESTFESFIVSGVNVSRPVYVKVFYTSTLDSKIYLFQTNFHYYHKMIDKNWNSVGKYGYQGKRRISTVRVNLQ